MVYFGFFDDVLSVTKIYLSTQMLREAKYTALEDKLRAGPLVQSHHTNIQPIDQQDLGYKESMNRDGSGWVFG